MDLNNIADMWTKASNIYEVYYKVKDIYKLNYKTDYYGYIHIIIHNSFN